MNRRCYKCGDLHDCRTPSKKAAAQLRKARNEAEKERDQADFWRNQCAALMHSDWQRAIDDLQKFKAGREVERAPAIAIFAAVAAGVSPAAADACFALPPGTAEAFSEAVQIAINDAWLEWQWQRSGIDGTDLFHDFDHPFSTIQRGVDPWRVGSEGEDRL